MKDILRPPHRSDQFLKMSYWGIEYLLIPMVKAKVLKGTDSFVLQVIPSFGSVHGYKVRCKPSAVAKKAGLTLVFVQTSISRLIGAGLICKGVDEAGLPYYVIEPSMIEFNSSVKHRQAAIDELDRAKAERNMTIL